MVRAWALLLLIAAVSAAVSAHTKNLPPRLGSDTVAAVMERAGNCVGAGGAICVRVRGRFLLELAYDQYAAAAKTAGRLRVGDRVTVSCAPLRASEMDRGRLFTGELVDVSAPGRRSRSAPSSSIRDIDFRNFDYPQCDGPTARLRRGRHRYGETPHDTAELKSVRYVDIDGDRVQDAFVVVDWSSSGSVGGGVNAYLFSLRAGTPVNVWSRCGGRSTATLAGRTIRFTYPEYVGDDANCCPTYSATDTYAWRGGGLVRIAKKRTRHGN